MSLRTLIISAVALSLSAPVANAGITGVSGATTWLGSPPAACLPGTLSGLTAFAWDEQQNVPLSITANMINNPGVSSAATPGPILGNFDSHFIHFEGIPGVINAVGTVTFNTTIAAVDFLATDLDATDASAGSFGTVYPTLNPARGIPSTSPSFFSISGNVLSFNLTTLQPAANVAQIRVFTHVVPAPASAGVLALGSLAFARRRRRA
jgi:hypothetical protein